MRTLDLKRMLLGMILWIFMSGGAYATTAEQVWAATNPAVVNQSVNLFGSFAGINPTGTVTFKDGTTTLGTVSISNPTGSPYASAMLTTSFAVAGNHSINVRYNGDGNDGAVAQTFTLVVNAKATTSTSLSVNPNPALKNQTVTLSASVSSVNGSASRTGTVTFKNGATVIGTATVASGAASLTTSFANEGSYSITATYNGDANNYASTSPTGTLQVAGSITTLSFPSGPVLIGQAVAFTANVTGNSPTGTVTFKDGATTIGTGTLNASGVATLSTSFATAGTHSLTAVYGGDANNPTSTSAAQNLEVKSSITQLVIAPNPVVRDQPVTFTATVLGNSPTGNVTFKEPGANGNTYGTATLNSSGVAVFTTSFANNNNYYVIAVYNGDANHASSASPQVGLNVLRKAATTTVLVPTPNPAGVGQAIALTATVSGYLPTGNVEFRSNGQNLGTAPVNASGIATLNKTYTAAGSYSLTANYKGDSQNEQSNSASVSLPVNTRAATATSLAANPQPVSKDQPITLTATVTGNAPAGSVTFKDGAAVLGTANVDVSGVATLTTSFAIAGSHSLIASYAGDSTNMPSDSLALAVSVSLPATTTSLALSDDTVFSEEMFTLTATVAGSTPTGTVTFKANTTVLGTVALDASGAASLTTSISQAGSYPVIASYGGDLENGSSDSLAGTLQVAPRAVTTVVLAASPNSVTVEQTVTLTASVTGNAPSGSVVFKEGVLVLGTAVLDASGVATFPVSFAAAGARTLTASYSGNVSNAGSDAAAVVITVNSKATTTVALIAAPTPVMAEQAVTLTVSVIGNAPTGIVVLRDGTVELGQGAVDAAGTFTLVIPFIVSGSHTLSANYLGDAFNLAGSSANVPLTVTPPLCQ